jgi:hypothetical protein
VHAEAHRCWCASRARSGPIPVVTTGRFLNLTRTNGPGGTGTHTFTFIGRKVEAGDTNGTVLDASMSVICVHR